MTSWPLTEAFKVTIVSLLIWVVFFPVLVQGLIVYAVILARGEKRANDEYRRATSAKRR